MSFFKKLKDKFTKQEETVEESQALEHKDESNESNETEESAEAETVEDSSEDNAEAVTAVEESESDEEPSIQSVEETQPELLPEEKKESIADKFKKGLSKTRNNFSSKVNDLVAKYRKVDEDFFEELEEILIGADVGVNTVMELIEELEMEVKRRNIKDTSEMREVISEKLVEIYQGDENEGVQELNVNNDGLSVVLFVGVNGVGKTTTIGKMAHRLKQEGKTVMLAAGDTFRAGAIEQLEVWGERVGVDVIKHSAGSDPAAVVYDAVQAAKARGVDVLLCDTAGRLQNKVNLMNELSKVKKVISREVPDAPHDVMLVLDATTGQNAMSQAKTFSETTDVTGIVLTKLDGTAKGGIVLAIRNELNIPVKYVGLGEKMTDLQTFDPDAFVYGLFADMLEETEEA
ncbi:cell division protein FtsY [Pontibacillus halophilus JSM 076056 = DSM 19796]|uniref:Signal recognition particle receptor FtsY n=1 Tax=Pontibacillus halophilus JSM 076056 = DSM 19796 TaxID=1385510 RepID=A0A0A5GMI4_9BACI|nr:signal recognition particle-docking protein FtsY [Pontibacillus halophilus]KGX93194.1 cell division protein FtsY [Pontibacillus halophilus JSM 076056 = DSM 19796]